MKDNLVNAPEDRPKPDAFHARTGHELPVEKSEVYKHMISLSTYANENDMKLNFKKTKLMVFNTGKLMELECHEIEVVKETRILGFTIRSDMRWSSNTDHIVIKAYKKLWILRRLKMVVASSMDLLDVYMKQVRSILELAVPAWHSGITVRKSTKGSPPDHIRGELYIIQICPQILQLGHFRSQKGFTL